MPRARTEAADADSAGVYFLSVEEFEARSATAEGGEPERSDGRVAPREVSHEWVSLPLPGERTLRAHLARPEAKGAVPGLLVLHEILGLTDDICRIAGRFAAEGYAALAPDLFAGRGPKPLCIVRTMAAIARGEGKVVDDMLSARDWLAAQPGIDGDRIGVAGFCLGGGFALLLGSVGDFKVAAPYYGQVATSPHRYRTICPVVSGYGGRDLVFARHGARLEAHLKELGVAHDVEIYEGAGHGYMSQHSRWLMALAPFSPLRPGYDEAAAEDSWRRMLDFFRVHMGPSEDAR